MMSFSRLPLIVLLLLFFLPSLWVLADPSPTNDTFLTNLSSPTNNNAAANSANGAGDVLSRSAVIVTFAGVWTPAAVRSASFAAAVEKDVANALGPQRAAAWPAAPPDANGGLATIELEAWGDGGTLVDRVLLNAAWTQTEAYYAEATQGEGAAGNAASHLSEGGSAAVLSGSGSILDTSTNTNSDSWEDAGVMQRMKLVAVDAAAFVSATRRSEDITIRFNGSGWMDVEELPDAELSEAILTAVQSVVDPTNTGGNLRCSLEDQINRTVGVEFNLMVTSSGIQNITHLLASPSLYEPLLTHYANVTEMSDGALLGVYRTAVSKEEQEYRTQVHTIFSGSWHLVLQSAKPKIMSSLRTAIADALELNSSRVVLGDVSAKKYPYHMEVTSYVIHKKNFPVNNIIPAIAGANFSQLFDDIYIDSGGDTNVVPTVMRSDMVNPRVAEEESPTPLTSTHNLLLSGEEWPEVLHTVEKNKLKSAIENDLTELLPYRPSSVSVLGFPQANRDDGLRVAVSVTQKGTSHVIPIAVNSYFVQASSLPLTQAIYTRSVDAANTEIVNVTCATVKNTGFRSICTSRCIGVAAMGGALLLFCIIGFIIYCVWRSLARYVDPKKDDEFARIPAQLSPFAGGPVTNPNYNPARSLNGSIHNVNHRVGDPGPMYPPGTSGPAPFAPRNVFSSSSAPESRLVTLAGSQSNLSVVRQSGVFIPSSTGERNMDMVMMPRAEYERQYNN
ncbi:hypothetical protein LSM04_007164 [Trypanosoma melophagium]|uniref:uncharacterized protein n=1 Tax=Trypanosoma melophagium TaxID=715481 RepID=UPI00351A0374|nr:hypothetical protein LSM04_007164 [Trypanosoma melophagium]